ncbi:MAG: UDP-N-acetylenolpyruvoylglucosamine reductase [Desulfobulbus propionicus]|nr:MAG: UDP-N-acetylenolpyruvoylglucosamine reductase [Desulfobulbus propionicus]
MNSHRHGYSNVLTPEQRNTLGRICASALWDVDMGRYSTFRTGGQVDALVTVELYAELEQVIALLKRWDISWQILGGGSNILVASDCLHLVLLRLGGNFTGLELEMQANEGNDIKVRAGAGCRLSRLLSFCLEQELSGLEWMAGIPGTVGGAICMNAGAHGNVVADTLKDVEAVDSSGKRVCLTSEEITFGYRRALLPLEDGPICITRGRFLLQKSCRATMNRQCREYRGKRKKTQPVSQPSAGSFFKNPEGDAAGHLIEQAGLKGIRCGGAMVSPQHANFIVNTGAATPQDVLDLMQLVQDKVFACSGIVLEPEVKIL